MNLDYMKIREKAQRAILAEWIPELAESVFIGEVEREIPQYVTIEQARLDVVEFQRLREKARLSAQ